MQKGKIPVPRSMGQLVWVLFWKDKDDHKLRLLYYVILNGKPICACNFVFGSRGSNDTRTKGRRDRFKREKEKDEEYVWSEVGKRAG